MTVFKTFLKVLNKNKATVILYTAILLFFGGLNMKTNDNNTSFVASKPDILIVNNDKEEGITKSLIKYLENNCNKMDIEDESDISDALFYRDVNYIVYIPENFRDNFLANKNPKIEVKSTGDYQASLAEMMLERYLNLAKTYQSISQDEKEIISNTEETLTKEAKIEITSKLDTQQLDNAARYFNFANYSLLAGCVFVICMILSSFKEDKIRKRTIISSMNYKTLNNQLLLSNSLFAILLWLFYVVLSIIFVGKIMFTIHGLFYIINSFVFTICSLVIAFLIGNLVTNKNAINGIVNVIALGSSFLCGAFVPMEFLPDSVLKIAHILPSYWYIKTNEIIKTTEVFNTEALKPIVINIGVVILFIVIFIIITNIISSKKRKSN